jgi:hypothetical protein
MFWSNPKKSGILSSYRDTIIGAGWIKLNSWSLPFQRKAPNINFATEANCQEMFSILQPWNGLSSYVTCTSLCIVKIISH